MPPIGIMGAPPASVPPRWGPTTGSAAGGAGAAPWETGSGDGVAGGAARGIDRGPPTLTPPAGVKPPPPPPKSISITGGGSIGPSGKDNNFGFNADNRPTGHLEYQDKGMGINLNSSSVDFFNAPAGETCASFGGTARLNGEPGHIFTVNACDNGEPGKGVDSFTINIDANYSRSGKLTRGNIQLHEK